MTVFIYSLNCPDSGEIRYIGKAIDPNKRYNDHIYETRKLGKLNRKCAWIKSLLNNNKKPVLNILRELGENEDWAETEIKYISDARKLGLRLTNMADGGEGIKFSDPEAFDIWKNNVKFSLSSPEVRKRISEKVKASYSSNPQKRLRRARLTQELWKDESYRSAMVSQLKERASSPESRLRMARVCKERMENPAERTHVSNKLKAFYATEEGKLKKIATSNQPEKKRISKVRQEENWKNPEYRASMMEKMTEPEYLKKQAERASSQWSDPEKREKILAGMRAAQNRRNEEKLKAKETLA